MLCGAFCPCCVACQLNDETKARGNVKSTTVSGTGLSFAVSCDQSNLTQSNGPTAA
jgi:hypothetical protein